MVITPIESDSIVPLSKKSKNHTQEVDPLSWALAKSY